MTSAASPDDTEPLPDAPVLDDPTTGELELEERSALRRVAGLSTELEDISEVEYRQIRLERVVLVGVWTEGTLHDVLDASGENDGVLHRSTFFLVGLIG